MRVRSLLLAAWLFFPPLAAQVPAREALRQSLGGSGAVVIVMDASSGRVVASAGNVAGGVFTPGSTLKPFVLLAALEHGVVRPQAEIECRGTLQVAGRNLACTHPRELRSFTAERALAYSCNAYFAAVAQRMDAGMLRGALGAFGLRTSSGGAMSPDGRVLLTLGLTGIDVSPMQLAEAYRRLALAMDAAGGSAPRRGALQVVHDGLMGSASYGMANNAATAGVRLAGKTGTASEPGQARTHGWFAGIVYGADGRAKTVLVMLVPRGSGADAALLAHRVLLAEQGR